MQVVSPPPTSAPARSRLAYSRSTGIWQQVKKNAWSYAYLVPMLLLLLAFIIYPNIASLGYTFYQWNGIGDPAGYVGLDNFARVVRDPFFWGAFQHTLIYTAVLVPIQLVLALALALVLNNTRLRFSTFYRAVYFIPSVTSPAVVAVVIQLILTNFGDDLNQLLITLRLSHEHIDWLGNPTYALGIIIVIGIWLGLGINLVYFMAGLQTIPAELYEAARIDGASSLNCFVYVTIPMLRSIGLIIIILALLGSLQVFDLVLVMTNGGPYGATEVVNSYIYHQGFGDARLNLQPNVGFASAASLFYGLVLMALSIVQIFVFRSLNKHNTQQSAG
ncbi:ABC transporter permease [Dictyobacter alpinus]|uniref:ABC transporter permease n=1 Tax=Dictyobacter alpinus TaxID=2014873 RepID=A0A402BEF7_9CHLR|nr:sugar ABC transporter permease [Dictyobacter alpinus]GCE29637.1 ABC transporter permease [Dictyobacter alpinus]